MGWSEIFLNQLDKGLENRILKKGLKCLKQVRVQAMWKL